MVKKIIITGATGFVCEKLIERFLEEEIYIVILAKHEEISLLQQKYTGNYVKVIELDLEDIKKLPDMVTERSFDVFYHFHWKGLDGNGLTDWDVQLENVKEHMECLQIAKEMGCKKFIGIGTVAQLENSYGGYKVMGDRNRYYRVAKEMCERMGRELARELDIEFIWPMVTNIYGEGEISYRFINTLLRTLIKNESIDTSSGIQTYDFIHVQDAVEIFLLLGMYGKGERKYVIGSGEAKPLREWIAPIPEWIRSKGKINWGTKQYNGSCLGEDCFDTTELYEDVSYKPQISFKEGIMRTADWQRRVNV